MREASWRVTSWTRSSTRRSCPTDSQLATSIDISPRTAASKRLLLGHFNKVHVEARRGHSLISFPLRDHLRQPKRAAAVRIAPDGRGSLFGSTAVLRDYRLLPSLATFL